MTDSITEELFALPPDLEAQYCVDRKRRGVGIDRLFAYVIAALRADIAQADKRYAALLSTNADQRNRIDLLVNENDLLLGRTMRAAGPPMAGRDFDVNGDPW